MESSNITETISKEILDKLKEELESGICQELTTIWTKLYGEEDVIKRKQMLAIECQQEAREFLTEVLNNEKKIKDEYTIKIKKLLEEIKELQKLLEISIPYENFGNLPLHITADKLNKKTEKYRAITYQRVHKLNVLLKKEAMLCEKLGIPRLEINTSEIPSKAKLKFFEDYIKAKEQEKLNRKVTFLEQREAVIKLYEDLGSEPVLNFEKEIVSEESIENFALTIENLSKLGELRNNLDSQLKEAEKKVEELISKLNVLWSQVKESEAHTKQFLSKNKGCTVDVINALKKEVVRCETMRREIISKTVKKFRKVLVKEWDRCLICQEEREKFRPFNINCFTEDVCDLYKLEITRLKTFYSDNEQIFVLISKHEKLFSELLDLEYKSKNADRYQNRGGYLLQEEKKRRYLTKELPAVEEKLRMLLKEYLRTHGVPFTSFGVPMETILDEQWKTHFDQKTMEKLFREKKVRTPLGKEKCTTPRTPASANKISRLNCDKIVLSATRSATPRIQVRSLNLRKRKIFENKLLTRLNLEPTYDEYLSGLQSKIENSASNKNWVLHSTAIMDTPPKVLLERNTPNKAKLLSPMNSTSGKTSPLIWFKSMMKTPKTVPRARRQSQISVLTPTRNRLSIII